MGLSVAHLNHVRKTENLARTLLDMKGALAQNKILFSGTPNYAAAITQPNLEESFPDGGITTANLADAQYALAVIDDTLSNALVALTVLANLP